MPDVALDPVGFASRVLHVELWPHQIGPVRATAPNVVLRGGRRGGKTLACQVKAIFEAASHRNSLVLVICPNIERARDWLRECADLMTGTRLADSVVDEQAQRIIFKNGSEVRAIPATAGQLRGFGRNLRLVVLEESGFLAPSTFRDIRYALLDNVEAGAQLYMSSSPWGAPEHPFRQADTLAQARDPDYVGFVFRATDNPKLPADYIARERFRLAPAEAAAELDGEWSDAIGSLFPQSLLERVTADIVVPPLRELGAVGGIVAIDWGISFDQTAFGFLHRTPVEALNPDTEHLPTFVFYPFLRPPGEEMRESVAALTGSPVRPAFIAPETVAHGAYGTQELRHAWSSGDWHRRWCEVATSAATKTSGYPCAVQHLSREQIILPRDPDLLRQLAGVRYEQGSQGTLRVGAESEVVHDDLPDCLYLAMLPHRRPGMKRVRCEFEHLAALDKAPPDAHVAAYNDESVETGPGSASIAIHRYKPSLAPRSGGLSRPSRSRTASARTRSRRLRSTGSTKPSKGGPCQQRTRTQ